MTIEDPYQVDASNHYACSATALQRYLDGIITSEEQQFVESHLNTCSHCQNQMNDLVGDAGFWDLVSKALDESSDLWSKSFASRQQEEQFCDAKRSSSDDTVPELAEISNRLKVESVAGYRVLGVLGQGGMGIVFRAYDEQLQRELAIKTIAPYTLHHKDARNRFLREARAAAALRHPHIVPIFAVESSDDIPFIVMPLIEGGTLSARVKTVPISLKESLHVTRQIASALSAMHQIGIIHRDLKPSNVLLQDDYKHVMLSDFGLAKFEEEIGNTQSEVLAGTPHFMSPEQALGKRLTVRSDIFSLGSLLYWLVTSEYPFVGTCQYEILNHLIHGEWDQRRLEQTNTPKPIIEMIQAMLQPNPDDRLKDARQVVEQIDSYLSNPSQTSHELVATRDVACLDSKSKRTERRFVEQYWIASASVLVASLVSILVIGQWKKSEADASPVTPQNSSLDNTFAPHSEPDFVPEQVGQMESLSASTHVATQVFQEAVRRQGPIDELDLLVLKSDMESKQNEQYWLQRLTQLDVTSVPSEAWPHIELLAENSEEPIRSLAQSLLKQNPFVEVDRSNEIELVVKPSNQSSESQPQNPFEMVPEFHIEDIKDDSSHD